MWQLPANSPTLAPGETHLWVAECVPPLLDLAWCAELLTSSEMARARRFATETLRRRYLQAHTLLHTLLRTYTGSTAWELAYQPNGKAYLVAPQLEPRLEFNLSHAGEVVLIAVARGHDVGVDVELARPLDDLDGLIGASCTGQEVACLAKLAPNARLMAFYWLWTRKEAWLKLMGAGLGGNLQSVEVHNDPQGVTLLELSMPERAGEPYVGALALPAGKRAANVQRFEALWQGV